MAIKYFKSRDVKVFPCAYRGYYELNGQQISFDPEARLTTEENLAGSGSAILAKPFIGETPYDWCEAANGFSLMGTTPMYIAIGGHKFLINKTLADLGSGAIGRKDIYFGVCFATKELSADNTFDSKRTTKVIASLKRFEITTLDEKFTQDDVEDYYFTGACYSLTKQDLIDLAAQAPSGFVVKYFRLGIKSGGVNAIDPIYQIPVKVSTPIGTDMSLDIGKIDIGSLDLDENIAINIGTKKSTGSYKTTTSISSTDVNINADNVGIAGTTTITGDVEINGSIVGDLNINSDSTTNAHNINIYGGNTTGGTATGGIKINAGTNCTGLTEIGNATGKINLEGNVYINNSDASKSDNITLGKITSNKTNTIYISGGKTASGTATGGIFINTGSSNTGKTEIGNATGVLNLKGDTIEINGGSSAFSAGVKINNNTGVGQTTIGNDTDGITKILGTVTLGKNDASSTNSIYIYGGKTASGSTTGSININNGNSTGSTTIGNTTGTLNLAGGNLGITSSNGLTLQGTQIAVNTPSGGNNRYFQITGNTNSIEIAPSHDLVFFDFGKNNAVLTIPTTRPASGDEGAYLNNGTTKGLYCHNIYLTAGNGTTIFTTFYFSWINDVKTPYSGTIVSSGLGTELGNKLGTAEVGNTYAYYPAFGNRSVGATGNNQKWMCNRFMIMPASGSITTPYIRAFYNQVLGEGSTGTTYDTSYVGYENFSNTTISQDIVFKVL